MAITALHLIEWIFWRVGALLNNIFQPKVLADLSNYCFANLHKHSFSYFNNNFVGSLVRRVNKFTTSFERMADKIIWNILQLAVYIISILIILFGRNPALGTIVLVWITVFLIINWVLSGYKMKYDVARSAAETKTTAVLADTITNNVNVKLFNGYARERKLYASVVEKVRSLRKLTWDLDAVFEGVQALLMIALEVGMFYFAIGLWQKGILTVGDFVLIQSYLLTIFLRVWDFGKLMRNMYEDMADAEDMTIVLNTPFEIQDSSHARPLRVKKGELVFENVYFNYHSNRAILHDLNLAVKSHERLALVGPSGAGKTTIIKLLFRMHEISGGRLSIDGQDIKKITMESLWKNVSMVPQDPMLFHRTLLENIRYGKPEATDGEVIKAAKLANCHEFIMDFPDAYGTFVGERGVKLSGGERQRVAIARAILRNAPILVLDEATSSLDSESERLIQGALDNLMRAKTVIIIAHRLSTIMKTDRIIVLNKGRIAEEGSHKELLQKKSGIYKRLWSLQAGGFIQA